MSEQREFSRGGLIPGGPIFVPMERIGTCIDGHCLYRIDGGPPEHIMTADEVRRRDMTQMTCGKTSPDEREGAA